MAFTWFTFICGVYVISFWLPTLIKGAGITDPWSIGLYSMIPYGTAAISMVLISRHSDKTCERRWHTALCAFIGAAALTGFAMVSGSLYQALVVISLATSVIFSLQPLFWAIATDYLGGTRAAAGTIAFINSLGLTGGFASPSLLGWIKTTTGSLNNGLFVIAAFLVVGGLITLKVAKKEAAGMPMGRSVVV